jgi:serine/threonine protein kinase/tetratricopeptide (TPR) repeat protein
VAEDLWKQVQQLFDAALQHSPEKRQEFLEQECGSNQELRREVESLLAAHDESDSFMAEPAVAGKAEVLLRATSRFQPGDMLGAYKILDLVGRGGMGEVYRARDTRLKRDVAIKVLPRALTADRERLSRFEQEARSAAALNHPNIISVHDMGTADGSPYIVSELLEGQNLREVLRRGPVPARKVLDYALQAARGLAAAHDAGIVHRDLKPENLFITKGGQLKILDFGLAKLTRSEEGGTDCSTAEAVPGTEAGTVFGTGGYMSPEQVRGQSADHRSDIFSFGAILYELFSGKRAFRGDSPADTMSAILHEDPPELTHTTPPVHPAVDRSIRHCLEKNPLERFQSAHDLAFQLQMAAEGPYPTLETAAMWQRVPSSASVAAVVPSPSSAAVKVTDAPVAARKKRWNIVAPVAVILVAAAIEGAFYFRSRQPTTPLTDKDSIVLADFANTTGDPVFDDALKQGLSISLSQSPFLSTLSDRKVSETLKLMGRTSGDRLTPELTREICVRTNCKAMLAGSIYGLGTQYVIGLKAVNCETGETLAQEQVQAIAKEEVLKALDQTANSLRAKLGESLSTVQRFSAPLGQATTPSLEALRAFGEAQKSFDEGTGTAVRPLLKRAIELDPNFALAYTMLGVSYNNSNEHALANENLQKAYELRDRVSEREKYVISALYYGLARGELEKSNQVYEQWARTYPRDSFPLGNLAGNHIELGQYEKALPETKESLRLRPKWSDGYGNLAYIYLALNRPDDAKKTIEQAQQHKLDGDYLHQMLYYLAFMRGDTWEMQQQVAWATGKPGIEDVLFSSQSDTEAYYGRLAKARDFARLAVASAVRADSKETAALWKINAALRESEFGNHATAEQGVTAALALAPSRDVKLLAALTLAQAGKPVRAKAIVDELEKTYPSQTMLETYWLPSVKAALELNANNSVYAMLFLEGAAPYELGSPAPLQLGTIYPAYIRGQAQLAAHNGAKAAIEFQKFLNHRGITVNFPLGALAHLGLARAYAVTGDVDKARMAYQDFFNLWKDADPDIPILKQAKAEYAKLQ